MYNFHITQAYYETFLSLDKLKSCRMSSGNHVTKQGIYLNYRSYFEGTKITGWQLPKQ